MACYCSRICLIVPIVITCSVIPQRSKTLESGMVVSSPDHIFRAWICQLPIPFLFKGTGILAHWFNAWHYQRLDSTLLANDLLEECKLIGQPCRLDYSVFWKEAVTSWWFQNIGTKTVAIGSLADYFSLLTNSSLGTRLLQWRGGLRMSGNEV